MRLRSLLLCALLLPPGAALAADPIAPSADQAAPPTAQITATLRDEYILGEPILVPIVAQNPGDAPVSAPDLSSQPWRVQFELALPSGQTQRRRTSPPEGATPRSVTIPPRGQRRTLLEIPSGSRLKAGEYGLTVNLVGGETPVELATRPAIHVVPARPISGDLVAPAASQQGARALWLHKAAQGFDLYLQQSVAGQPGHSLGDYALTHLEHAVNPVLSAVRPSDDAARHVVWLTAGRTIHFARLQGVGLRGGLDQVDVPWPVVELVGRPATDANGTLHVPLWVSAPKGVGGELRVVSIGGRAAPGFRRIASYDSRPAAVVTSVGAAGIPMFLVLHDGKADLYSVREQANRAAQVRRLPLAGHRVADPPPDQGVVGAAFGTLPASKDFAGGTAILLLQSSETGLVPRWVGLQGSDLLTLPVIAGTTGLQLRALLPHGDQPPGVVLRGSDGVSHWYEGAHSTAFNGTGSWGLLRDAEGRALVQRLVDGGPVRVQPL